MESPLSLRSRSHVRGHARCLCERIAPGGETHSRSIDQQGRHHDEHVVVRVSNEAITFQVFVTASRDEQDHVTLASPLLQARDT